MVIAVFTVVFLAECCFRIYYFGSPAIYKFWEYTPKGLVRTQFVEASPNKEIGFKLAPSKSGRFKGGEFSTNSLGLRGPHTTVDKPHGVYRVAILGGSKDMGTGVADNHVYTSILQQQFDELPPLPVEIINFAIGGYHARQTEAYFWEYVKLFEPDLVLLSVHVRRFPSKFRRTKFLPKDVCWKIDCLFKDLFSFKAARIFMRDRILYPLSEAALFGTLGHWGDTAKQVKQRSHIKSKKIKTEQMIYSEFIGDLKSNQYDVAILRLPCFCENVEENTNIWNRWTKRMNPELIIDDFPVSGMERPSDYQIYYGDNHPNADGHAIFAEGVFKALRPFVETKLSANLKTLDN